MTAPTLSLGRVLDDEASPRRWWPSEGWTTLVAVTGLPLAVAWSIDNAGWLPGLLDSTGYLPWLAVASTALGILLAKLGLGRFRSYLIGSVVGGLVLPLLTGNAALGKAHLGLDPASLLASYRAAAVVANQVWVDLVVNGQPFTTASSHYHMIFGGIVWAAGLLAAVAAIGRRRPLDAVIVTGLLLLTNEALTEHEQIPILVFFSVAALVLLIRSHVFEEQETWIRRRIGDPGAISGLYLQSGATFVAAAVLGALVLTGTASSAPLQGAWADVPQRLAELSRWLERFAPPGGDPRSPGLVGFLPSVTTNGLWAPDPSRVAFVAHLPAGDTRPYRWRAGTYATYTLFGWDWGGTHEIPRDAGTKLLAGTGDDPSEGVAGTDVQINIDPEAFIDATALSPATITSVDRQATFLGVGDLFRFTTVRLAGGSGPYTVDALIPNIGDTGSGITENRLRAAGRAYPSDIASTYLQLPEGALGSAAQAMLDKVEATLGSKAEAEAEPYDLARALERYLRDPANFQYQTDVRTEVRQSCSGLSTVECFAEIHRGYCEYYASTMAVLLRAARIPARIAYGFLPGDRLPDGAETVPASAAHWWVEVYFPNSGWVEFDPTGTVGQPQALPSGAPVTPAPSTASFAPRETDLLPPRSFGPGGGGGTTTPTTGSGPFAVIALLLIAAVAVVAIATRRRTAPKPMHPDAAWGGLGRLAGRFGFGPRPSQTVYEYAGALADVVPTARVEVGTVARAKVETAYGRHELGEDRMRRVGDAYRRLRLAVFRAGLARRFRRRKG